MDRERAIEAFLASADAGSFSAAAARLGLTAAAVSRQVARLEADLRVRLFNRTTRSLSLTESGIQLRRGVDEPWHAMRSAMERLRQGRTEPHGSLRISVGTAFGIRQLVPRMGEFLRRYPGIGLDWSFENRRVRLVEEGFDAAIGMGLDPDSRVVARPICPVDPVVCAAPAWIERHGRPQRPGDLPPAEAVLLRSATTGRLREPVLERDGERHVISARPRLAFTELDAIRQAALSGFGYALLGPHHVADDLETGRLERLLPEWSGPRFWIQVYYPARDWLEPKVRVFIDFLIETFEAERFRRGLERWL